MSTDGRPHPRFADSLDAAMERLEKLLIEERAYIVKMDADAVSLAASEKESLVSAIARGLEREPDRKAEMTPRLRAVTGELRRNGVLLAHARDCLRDALSAFDVYEPGASRPSAGGSAVLRRASAEHLRTLPTFRPGRRLSVTG